VRLGNVVKESLPPQRMMPVVLMIFVSPPRSHQASA
jgi:hypothetical protein